MERVSQLVGAFLTFAPEMLDLSGGPLFRRRARLDNWGATHRISGLARRPTALRPLDCSRLRRSHVLSSVSMHFDAIYGEPGVHFGHLVHQTFKNENTLREDCMRRSCSCIQKRLRKFWPERQAVPNGVNGERRMHHRLSDAVVEAILTGGARCAPATPRSRFSVASSAAVRTSRDPTARRGKARRA